MDDSSLPQDLILAGNAFTKDNEHRILFLPGIVQNLNQIQWRRIDVEISSMFNHETIIQKASLPCEKPQRGMIAVSTLIKLLRNDAAKKEYTWEI